MCGRGRSTNRNRLKDLLTQGDITDAVLPNRVWHKSKWSGTDPTRECSSSPTRRSTTTLLPPTATPSPEPLARKTPPPTLLPLRRRWKVWNLVWGEEGGEGGFVLVGMCGED
ncbi:hypothetical protein LINPERPRIM_LOCUS36327 [Linum perenne]